MDGTSFFLQLNEAKTECLVLGSIMSPAHILAHLGPLASNVYKQANNLGVIFNSELKFDKHVNAVLKPGFFHLRRTAKIKPFLYFNDLKQVIQAFIFSRLNY